MMDTTRRYPRTELEAFKGPEYANWIEHFGPPPSRWKLPAGLIALTVLLLFIASCGF